MARPTTIAPPPVSPDRLEHHEGPGPGRVMVSTWDLAQIRTIAEASARIIQNDGRTQDARVLREVVARFDQVAGPLEDHYGQVEQWKTLILGRP